MFGHYPLQTAEQALKKYAKDRDPKCNFFCSEFCGNPVGEEGSDSNHDGTEQPYGDETFAENFDDNGKI